MVCKKNTGVLDKSVTLISCIWINKDGKIWANVHFYKTIGQKTSLGQINRLPNHDKCRNLGYFGRNIGYQIGISALAINQTDKLKSYRSPNDSRLIGRLIGIAVEFLNTDSYTFFEKGNETRPLHREMNITFHILMLYLRFCLNQGGIIVQHMQSTSA
jgi:hypothetical protein